MTETKRPVGRPPKNGTAMSGAQRAAQFRQREKIRDHERFLEIMSVIRDEYCYENTEHNHNEKARAGPSHPINRKRC